MVSSSPFMSCLIMSSSFLFVSSLPFSSKRCSRPSCPVLDTASIFFFLNITYLFGRVIEREEEGRGRDRERKKSSISGLPHSWLQWLGMGKSTAKSRKFLPGVPCGKWGSTYLDREPGQVLSHHQLLSQAY